VLRGEDIVRLRGRRWLNDEVINSFVALINMRNRKHFASVDTPHGSAPGAEPELSSRKPAQADKRSGDVELCVALGSRQDAPPTSRPRTYAFNSFFLPRLAQKSYDYHGVRRWTERAGVDVAKLDLVLVPVNLSNYHWVLAAADIRGRELIYFDSMYGEDDSNVLETLARWLVDEMQDKHGAKMAEEMNVPSWKRTVNPPYLPRQYDDGSCGLFTLYLADYLELGLTPDYSQDDMTILRKRAVLFLTQGRLPDA
jgi:sentrin-specific protease 1